MRHRYALAASTMLLTLAACTGSPEEKADPGSASPSVSSTPSEEAPPEWTGPTIPDGDYQQLLTPASLRNFGITQTPEEWAPDGTLTNMLRIAGPQWAQLANTNEDAMSVGSSGSLSYDQQGRLIEIEPCCGESRYTWRLDGDTLTIKPDLAWMRQNRPDVDLDSQDTRIWKMMCCGTWTKVG